MDQNVQYLYEYKNGKRIRNIGFMKIDKQMDKCTIEIYAKQMDDVTGIYFRKENGETYIGGWEPQQVAVEERVMEASQDVVMISKSADSREVDEYIKPSNVTYEKIQRQELSRLPRKEWRLANNTFLLHGYYNYHHLLYIEDDGRIWIGVPGIYHEKEKMAANGFGFTEFRRVTDVNIDLQENEQNTYEDFGYWCRQISI